MYAESAANPAAYAFVPKYRPDLSANRYEDVTNRALGMLVAGSTLIAGLHCPQFDNGNR